MITIRFEKPIDEMAPNQAPETTGAVALYRLKNRNKERLYKKMTNRLSSNRYLINIPSPSPFLAASAQVEADPMQCAGGLYYITPFYNIHLPAMVYLGGLKEVTKQ